MSSTSDNANVLWNSNMYAKRSGHYVVKARPSLHSGWNQKCATLVADTRIHLEMHTPWKMHV